MSGGMLVIESSTALGSIAIVDESGCRMAAEFAAGRGHCGELYRLLIGAPLDHVTDVVVGLGPGSYAGVRVALSVALGLSVTRGWTRGGVASPAGYAGGEYLVVGDARRDSFQFSHVQSGRCIAGPMLTDRTELEGRLEALPDSPVHAFAPIPGIDRIQLGSPSARLLGERLLCGSAERMDGSEPLYLRDPHITLPRPRPL